MKELVSIIVPIYNAEKYLNECIDSLLVQDYENIEVVLVNDGSLDSSEEICLEYAKKDKRVKYCPKPNGGVSSARNHGISNAEGKYIFFIDADDYLANDVISSLVKNTKSNKLISVKHKLIFDSLEKNVNLNSSYKSEEFIVNMLNGVNDGFIWGYLFDAKIVKEICFDEKTYYLEDMLFLIDYLKHSKIEEICYINNFYFYRQIASSITKNNANMFGKAVKIIYSLDRINERTNKKYEDLIDDKKVRMIDGLLRRVYSKKEIKEFVDNIELKKYCGNSLRYKFFSKNYDCKNVNILNLYCKLSRMLRKISR